MKLPSVRRSITEIKITLTCLQSSRTMIVFSTADIFFSISPKVWIIFRYITWSTPFCAYNKLYIIRICNVKAVCFISTWIYKFHILTWASLCATANFIKKLYRFDVYQLVNKWRICFQQHLYIIPTFN